MENNMEFSSELCDALRPKMDFVGDYEIKVQHADAETMVQIKFLIGRREATGKIFRNTSAVRRIFGWQRR
jgi:hypothetical protein